MGKRVTLLRHAKSSWDQPRLSDFDRPLNSRGERDAPAMGNLLHERNYCPQVIISSDAARAKTTAQIVATKIDYPAEQIRFRNSLYLASPQALLQTFMDEAENYADVMLVAHNPGLTELANQLGNQRLDNLPTAGW